MDHEDELVEDADNHLGRRALDRDPVALDDDLLVGKRLLDLAQVLVTGPQQSRHEVVPRDEDLGAQGRGHDALM